MPYLLCFRSRQFRVSIVLAQTLLPVMMFVQQSSCSYASGFLIAHLTLAHHSSDASEQSRSLSLRTGWRRCGLRALDSGGRVRRWRRPRGRVRPGGRARSCWHTKVDTPTVWRFPLATSVEHVVRDATSDPERGRFVSSVSFVRSRIIACDAVGSVHGSIEHAGTTPLRFHSTTFSSVSHGSPLARILPSVSRTSIHPSLLLHDLHAPPERLRLITST